MKPITLVGIYYGLISIFCNLFTFYAVDNEDPCQRVQSYKNKGVQAVGEMSGKIILITDDWYVFEVPRDSLRPDLGKFYLNSGGKPKKTSEKWPELWKDSQFTKIRTESILAVSYVDSSHGQHDIRFETMLDTTDTEGVNFNVETRSVETGAVIAYNQYPYTCMGSGGGDTEWSYCFSKRPDGVIEITAWKWLGEKNAWWLRFYGGFPLCMSPNSPDQIYTHQEEDSTCGSDRNVDWPEAYHGFVSSGADESDGNAKFYLFAESYVLIFDETVFDMDCAIREETCDSPSTTYRKINYDDFIKCSGNVPPAPRGLTKKSGGLGWAIWLAIILLLLLLLLCCLLLLARVAYIIPHKPPPKVPSDVSTKTARISRLSTGFGFLTKPNTIHHHPTRKIRSKNSQATARSAIGNRSLRRVSKSKKTNRHFNPSKVSSRRDTGVTGRSRLHT